MAIARILVVEDDAHMRAFLVNLLEGEGYQMGVAKDGEEALRLAEHFRPNLALLDSGLPGIDGRVVARQLRERGEVGIIFVTGADSSADVRAGFDAGGDDYVVKPFDAEVLLRRVQAVLRRIGPFPVVHDVGGLVVDEAAHRVIRDGTEIELTAVEFDVLTVLVRQRGNVVATAQLLDQVWQYRYDAHVVESTVSRLRAKLEADGRPRIIHTVRGKGYTLRP